MNRLSPDQSIQPCLRWPLACCFAMLLGIAGTGQSASVEAADTGQKAEISSPAAGNLAPRGARSGQGEMHSPSGMGRSTMRSTGARVDVDGQLHVLCVDPSTTDLKGALQMHEQTSHHIVRDR